jgi:nitrite reductase (NADH) large subunit
LVLRGEHLVGCVLYGDVRDGPWYVELIQNATDTTPWRDHLIFGRAAADIVADEPAPTAARAA